MSRHRIQPPAPPAATRRSAPPVRTLAPDQAQRIAAVLARRDRDLRRVRLAYAGFVAFMVVAFAAFTVVWLVGAA